MKGGRKEGWEEGRRKEGKGGKEKRGREVKKMKEIGR